MTDNVRELYPCADLPNTLRRIADELEAGDYGETDQATLIFPGASEIFHIGAPSNDDNAPLSAMFNMQCGITKITQKVIGND